MQIADISSILFSSYQQLSTCLEAISSRKLTLEERDQRLWAVILEDDLAELLLECESILLAPPATRIEELLAFQARCETVVEEAVELLNKKKQFELLPLPQ